MDESPSIFLTKVIWDSPSPKYVDAISFFYSEHVAAQLQVPGIGSNVDVGPEVVRDLIEVS